MFLLDSNVVLELRSEKRYHPHVRAWENATATSDCWISVIVLFEIREGIEMVSRRDSGFADLLERWLESRVKPTFATRSLAVSAAISDRAGRISAIRTREMADCLIAATALEHGLKLATRNVADFRDIPDLRVVNPWEHPISEAG